MTVQVGLVGNLILTGALGNAGGYVPDWRGTQKKTGRTLSFEMVGLELLFVRGVGVGRGLLGLRISLLLGCFFVRFRLGFGGVGLGAGDIGVRVSLGFLY